MVLCHVRIRPDASNLFARLPPRTLRALMLLESEETTQPLQDVSKVEFLPLQITWTLATRTTRTTTRRTIYVSYNGGLLLQDELEESAAHDFWIQLPRDLFCDEDIDGPTSAEVHVMDNVPDATRLMLRPCTPRDYQLCVEYAEWLQDGGLLHQVSLVHHHQLLTWRVPQRHGKVRAHVSLENEPEKDTFLPTSELDWPESNDVLDSKATNQSTGRRQPEESKIPPCRRLVASSRLVVLECASKKDVGPLLQPCPTWNDYGSAFHALTQQQQQQHSNETVTTLPRPTPGTAWISVETVEELHLTSGCLVRLQVERVTSNSVSASLLSSVVVRIKVDSSVLSGFVALHPLQAQTLQIDPTSSQEHISVTPLAPWQTNQALSKLSTCLETGQYQLELRPVVLHSESILLDCVSQKHWEDLWESDSPCCVGSLISWKNALYQVQVASRGNHDDNNKNKEEEQASSPTNQDANGDELMIMLGSDLTNWLETLQTPSFLDETTLFLDPCTKLPRVMNLLDDTIVFPSDLLSLPIPCVRDFNIRLSGSCGSGKTQSALFLAALARWRFQASTVYFNCRAEKEAATQLEHLLQAITHLVESAISTDRPCVVVLDDLDEICPNFVGSNFVGSNNVGDNSSSAVEQTNPVEVNQAKIVLDHFRNELAMDKKQQLTFIVTCAEDNSVAWTLPHEYFVRHHVSLPVLTAPEKVSMLNKLLNWRDEITSDTKERRTTIATNHTNASTGLLPLEFRLKEYLPRDVEMVASRVSQLQHEQMQEEFVKNSAIGVVLDSYVSLNRRAAAEESTDTVLDWHQDIGGLFQAKQSLVDLVVRPMRFRRIYETSRIRLPKGIMLFGPPGCGKSILPASLAKLSGLPLIVCRGPEILDKYIGASERKVRELFQRANLSAPSILFIDELDALAPHRGSDLTGVTDRIVNQLLTFLDGVEDMSSSGKTVYIIGASSRPDKIDIALLRPGRLEKHIYVGGPDSGDELADAILKISGKYRLDPQVKESLCSGDYWNRLPREKWSNMSPSDIQAVFDTAHIDAIQDFLKTRDGENIQDTEEKPLISMTHLSNALRSSRPSLSGSERDKLRPIYDRFRHKQSKSSHTNTPQDQSPLKVALK